MEASGQASQKTCHHPFAMSGTQTLTTFVLTTPLKKVMDWLMQNVHELHNDRYPELGRLGKAL
eukprot:1527125-Rhodomonas_salina.1